MTNVIDTLTSFEQETFDTLRIDGEVVHSEGGERTLCELFGLPNSEAALLNRTLRHLVKVGLIVQLDGTRNAMRCRSAKLSHNKKTTTYRAAQVD